MLGISMRLAEPIDLGGSLQKYIQSNYTPEEFKSVQQAIVNAQNLRGKLVSSITSNTTEHMKNIELFTSYLNLLISLNGRFPFSGQDQPSTLGFKTGKVPAVKVFFSWYDSFKHNNRVQDYDINFEKSSILFNIAALYSRQATAEKAKLSTKEDDSALIQACKLFQISSGYFTYLSHSHELGAASGASFDLAGESLTMLSKLMLAQAQATFFEKATFSASPKLVAKLAAGVSELFKQTLIECEKPRLKQLQGKSDVYQWQNHCFYQQICYQAASHYWMAKGLQSEDEYGAEIAHLEKAKSLLDSTIKLESSLLKNLSENRSRLDQAIKLRLQQAIKENETIYYAAIPKQDTVRDPESVITVKPTPFELKLDPVTDGFAILISPEMRAHAADFKTKLNELVASQQRLVQESSDYAKMHLSSLNLPASLEALEPATGLPEDIWTQVQEVQYKGGLKQIEELNDRITHAVNDAHNSYQSIVDILSLEAKSDSEMRAHWKHRWNRRPSEQITVSFRKDLEAIHKFLDAADVSNNKVRGELSNGRHKLEALTQSRAEIESRLPHVDVSAKNSTSEALKGLLTELSTLLEKRNQVIANFAKQASTADIIPVLIANKNKTNEQLFNEEITKYSTPLEEVKQLDQQQTQLLERITEGNKLFESTKSKNSDAQTRQNVIQELNVGVQLFNKLLANFNEGLKFYSDLTTQRINPVRLKVDDFKMARDMESTMVLSQLTKDIAGFKEDSHVEQKFPQLSYNQQQPQQPSQQQPQPQIQSHPPSTTAYAPSASAYNPNLLTDKPSQPIYNSISPSPQAPQPTGPMFPQYSPNPNLYQPPQNQAQPYYAASSYSAASNPFQQATAPSSPPGNNNPFVAAPPGGITGTSSSHKQWACPVCTMLNNEGLVKCQACDGPKPK